ncbi:Breast carcinoma amplified sequence 3 [Lunasporangiospora selenospora]|uniref:Breast carcinoma amplified sequence 3 n=1 Tax=Lunasporangiospora selenospora TaxID=979761 RepID=A0A9P6G3A7_9FUNG|nr:Breast carcinoma amplified sequence 3 [Lunasporangiospora selenospora]
MADHQVEQRNVSGVRAEPVFIRDPSALESLSNVITGVSSYVASNFPASFSMPNRGAASPASPAHHATHPPQGPYFYPTPQGSGNTILGNNQDSLCVLTKGDVVLFSTFDWIETGGHLKNKASRRFCLLLGYEDGFQVWDLTQPDNIHEVTSIREPENEVVFLKVLPSPRVTPGKLDQFEQHRPLVAVISNSKPEDVSPVQKKLQIYSLATHKVVKTIDFVEENDCDILALDANERVIVVALSTPGEPTRLILLSQLTLHSLHSKQATLTDVASTGVFALGSRLLAYVTTSEASADNSNAKSGEAESESSSGYQDLAKGVAKEVFGGVKMLGAPSAASTSPPVQSGFSRSPSRHTRRTSASTDQDRMHAQAANRRRHDDNSPHKKEAVGTIMVRDISMPSMPVVAHFKSQDHSIAACKFSPSGKLLLTVPRNGNVFHIHELRPWTGSGTRHVYKLTRGITHAKVEDIVFNEDETWVAVTTGRGTTHLYAINPFGGSPDVGAHMYSGVVNWTATAIEFPMSLSALCRVKQRHHVPDMIISSKDFTEFDEFSNPGGPKAVLKQPNPHASRNSRSDGGNNSDAGGSGPDTPTNATSGDTDAPLVVQQQLASQGSLSQRERGPSFTDLYVFNPLGMLTLHRCWISSVRTKKTYNGRVVETSDLVVMPTDVAEWTLNRASDWETVKKSLAPPGTIGNLKLRKKAEILGQSAGTRSFATAEISTYDNGMNSGWKGQYPLLNQTLVAARRSGSTMVMLTQPQHLLWKSHQFSYQVYEGSIDSIQQELSKGKTPETRKLNLRPGVDIVTGKASRDTKGGGKSWTPGPSNSSVGRGSTTGHGRGDSHEGDIEDLSEDLSSAINSFMDTKSSSPINQSRMSPSIGSVSPSSFRAAALSFEDAYLISLGNASGSPRPSAMGSMGSHGHSHPQPYFLSTPPAELGLKRRSLTPSGASPGSMTAIAPTATYAFGTTPSSTSSPLISSFVDGGVGVPSSANGGSATGSGLKSGSIALHRLGSQPQSIPSQSQAAQHTHVRVLSSSHGSQGSSDPKDVFNLRDEAAIEENRSHSGLRNDIRRDNVSAQEGSRGQNPMAQSTMMMFSPDGDNEVDMPGSASIFIGAPGRSGTYHQERDRRVSDMLAEGRKRSSLTSNGHSSQASESSARRGKESTPPPGGVFHIDDDFEVFTSKPLESTSSKSTSRAKLNRMKARQRVRGSLNDDDGEDEDEIEDDDDDDDGSLI